MHYKSTFLFSFLFFLLGSLIFAQNNQPLTPIEQLGKKIYFDKISSPDWMSCATCHAPEVGFVGPIPGKNNIEAIYNGAIPQRFGNRKPPSAAYATFSPVFHYDGDEGLFVGGNFWDGRATGEHLGNPAADQAGGPFLNPVEQNNPSKEAVLMQVANSKYADLWNSVWAEPIKFDTPENIETNYDRVALSIAAYEGSSEVNSFTSKYDYYLKGIVQLSEQEEMGMVLFNGEKAKCSGCHISEVGPNEELPLFTDFTFDNLGTPKNPDNPFYNMDKVFLDDGSLINPDGKNWIDPGLGGFLAKQTNTEWQAMAGENMGKHKVPTLRNVDKKPGSGFIKAYMHNGVFKSLKEVVHFYNTRDVESWPPPEIAENVNHDELGNLGLTEDEEDAIVAFMSTLSDGYKVVKTKKDLAQTEKSMQLKVTGPNPFNPSTQLEYNLSEDADIELQVFNIVGQRVLTLQSGHMTAGTHQVEFNGSDLASGLYLVNLNTGKEMKTIKLMLMK